MFLAGVAAGATAGRHRHVTAAHAYPARGDGVVPLTVVNTGYFNGAPPVGLPAAAASALNAQGGPGVGPGAATASALDATVTTGAPLQPAAGYCWFGCFAGGSPAYPDTTYNGSTYESANMANRTVGTFQEYYAMDGGSGSTVPIAGAVTRVNAGRIISFELVPSFTIPPASGSNTTVASGSNSVSVSTFTGSGVLNVAAASATYPTSGTLLVVLSGGTVVTITYTGTSATTFTGCTTTAGSGTLATGNGVATKGSYGAVTIGAYDTFLTSTGSTISGLTTRGVFVQFTSEFDGAARNGYSSVANKAADYIAAHRHVANALRAGAPGMVAMGWCSEHASGQAAWYPGDAYVDWIGADLYDPTGSLGSATATYHPFITYLNTDPLAPGGGTGSGGGHGKPLCITETGTEPTYGSEAAWISGVPAALVSGTLTTTWGSQIQLWQWFNDLTGTWNTAITPGSAAATSLASAGATSFFNPP